MVVCVFGRCFWGKNTMFICVCIWVFAIAFMDVCMYVCMYMCVRMCPYMCLCIRKLFEGGCRCMKPFGDGIWRAMLHIQPSVSVFKGLRLWGTGAYVPAAGLGCLPHSSDSLS